MLTDDEVARFQDEGFLCLPGIFSPQDVERLRAVAALPAIERELAKRRADERIVHLIPLTTRHDAFKELARDPRITERVARLIGDDLQLSNSKLATKPSKPNAGAFDWHQDAAYYAHTNYDLVSVSLALDDVTAENGGMYAVRGSHRLGLLDHTQDGWMTGACVESRYWTELPEQVVPLMSAAGGLTIHHCLTLHGSPANRSGAPRRLIVFQYRAGDCYQLSDHTWDDTGFQVRGTPSGRTRCVAMDILLPKNVGWARYCGEPHGSVYRQIGEAARKWNQEPRDGDGEGGS